MNRPVAPFGVGVPFALLLVAAAWALGLARVGQAQDGTAGAWGPAVNLSSTVSGSAYPAIVADASGQVHVFWTANPDASSAVGSALFYTRWDGQGWTQPVDVMISPEGLQAQATWPAVMASPDGRLHLVWTGGWGNKIYYSSAWAGDAGSAQAWTRPVEVSQNAGQVAGPAIALDPQGNLHVIYHVIVGEEQGIYHVTSSDGGSRWSSPAWIPGSRLAAGTMLAGTRLAMAPDGKMHVVWYWAELPNSFPPKGIQYARSTDYGATWSEPMALAEGPFAYPDVASVGEDEVCVIWSGTAEQRSKFSQWSSDGGLSWSAPISIPNLGGFQGYPGMALDSAGKLHVAMVGSHPEIGDTLFHIAWLGQGWTEPEPLLRNSVSMQNLQYAAIAISEGNLAHVVVMYPVAAPTDPGYQFDIFYVSGRIDAPHVPPQPLPTNQPAAAALPTVVSIPEPTSAASPTLVAESAGPAPGGKEALADPGAPLLVGIASVVGVMAMVLLVWAGRRGRS